MSAHSGVLIAFWERSAIVETVQINAFQQFHDNGIESSRAHEGQANGGRSRLGPERLASLQKRHQKAFYKRQTPHHIRLRAQESLQESKACSRKMLFQAILIAYLLSDNLNT